MLALLFPLLVACAPAVLLVGARQDYHSIADALDAAAPGDIVRLVDAYHDLAQTLVIDRAVTIDVATETRSATLVASSEEIDVLLAINANDVTLRGLTFGRSANPRAIDVFVSAGTQGAQSSFFTRSSGYGGVQAHQKRSLSSALLASSESPGLLDESTRAIRNLALLNLDFKASISAINVAFDVGAYINVQVTRCVFGAQARALVTVPGARFASSPLIELNALASEDSVSLKGQGLMLGANFWSVAPPQATRTYCADRACTQLGPVIDADKPQRAFQTIAAALSAGVQHVQVTADRVEFGVTEDVLDLVGTTIRGRTSTACTDAASSTTPVVSISDGVVSVGGALVAMSDLRFEVQSGVPVAFSYTAAADGAASSDVLLERVSFASGDNVATLLKLESKSITLTLSRCTFLGGAVGVANNGGALTVTDSNFADNKRASIAIGGTGSGTGLRVSGSQFIAAPGGSIVFDARVMSAQMLPISVTCSRFVFAQFVEPADCLRNAQQCANALRYNTFIEVQAPLAVVANRRFLAHGNNHVEHVPAAQLPQYAQLQRSSGDSFAFSFADQQGRFGRVRADIVFQRAAHAFVLASNVPVRQECFAESVPGQRVVSGLFSLASDAPERCTSVALQFTVVSDAKDNSTAAANDGMSVYDVRHLGNAARGSVVWQKAASTVVLNKATASESNFVVEASSGAGGLLQAVVVAQTLNNKEQASALAAGDAARVARAHQHFCVACDGEIMPPYVQQERCDGGGAAHVFSDFDKALEAAQRAGDADSASLLVYGTRCATQQCTLTLSSASFTLEGFSVTQRASLVRNSSCAASAPMIRVSAPLVTVRYLQLGADTPLASAAPHELIGLSGAKSRVSFCTLGGGVVVRASNIELTGNELVAGGSGVALQIEGDTLNTLVQSNSIVAGLLTIAEKARHVVVDRNTFSARTQLINGGELTLTGNTFKTDSTGANGDSELCLTSSGADASLTSTGDSFESGCRLVLERGGRAHVTGRKNLAPWHDVVFSIDWMSEVRLANIDLLGARSQIVLRSTQAKDIVLYDIGIDLEQSSLSDTLVGRPLVRTPCSGANEPQIAGFALGDSLLLDAKTRRVLIGGSIPLLSSSEFIDPLDGTVVKCADSPDADYCLCMRNGDKMAAATRANKSTQPPQPIIAAVGKAAKTAEEPLAEDDDGVAEQVVVPRSKVRSVKKPAAVVRQFAVLQASSSFDNGRVRTGWIVGGILLGILVIIVICVACFCCWPASASAVTTRRVVVDEEDGTETIRETTTSSSNARNAGSRTASIGFGVTRDQLAAVKEAEEKPTRTILHRTVVSRHKHEV